MAGSEGKLLTKKVFLYMMALRLNDYLIVISNKIYLEGSFST